MNKQSITFIISSLNGGGAEKVCLLLMNEMAEKGWEVTLLMSKKEGVFLKLLDSKVKIVLLKNRRIAKNIIEIASYLKTAKPDVFYSSMMYINVVAGIAARLAGYKGKLIFSEHSHPSSVLRTQGSPMVRLIFHLAKRLYKYADGVICVSEGVKDDLKLIIKNLPDLFVINNPVEIKNFPVMEKKETDVYRIVSVGRLHKDKNFELLLEIAETIRREFPQKKIEFHILGDGSHRKTLENIIAEKKLEDCFFLEGFTDNPSEFINKCDLFVFTSNREGFGNVIVEALSTGIPVISTDCPSGPAEILGNGEYGELIPMNDKAQLFKKIAQEIENSSRFDGLQVKRRKERAADFRIGNIIESYLKVFNK